MRLSLARRSSPAEGDVVGLDYGYVRETVGSRSGSSGCEVEFDREGLKDMLSRLEVVRGRER